MIENLFPFRIDPWAKYVLPTPRHIYDHHFWNPPQEEIYQFKSPKPKRPASLKVSFIYFLEILKASFRSIYRRLNQTIYQKE